MQQNFVRGLACVDQHILENRKGERNAIEHQDVFLSRWLIVFCLRLMPCRKILWLDRCVKVCTCMSIRPPSVSSSSGAGIYHCMLRTEPVSFTHTVILSFFYTQGDVPVLVHVLLAALECVLCICFRVSCY